MYIVYMVYIVYAMYAVYRSLPPVVWGGGGPESLPRTPPYHWGGGGGRDHGSRDHIYIYIYIMYIYICKHISYLYTVSQMLYTNFCSKSSFFHFLKIKQIQPIFQLVCFKCRIKTLGSLHVAMATRKKKRAGHCECALFSYLFDVKVININGQVCQRLGTIMHCSI